MNRYRKHNQSAPRRKSYKPYSNTAPRSGLGGTFWLIIGIFIGVITTGILYIKEYGTASIKPYFQQLVDKGKMAIAPPKHVMKAQPPRFDFYTVLPNQSAGRLALQNPPAPPNAIPSTIIPPENNNPSVAPVPVGTQPVAVTTPTPNPITAVPVVNAVVERFILQIGAFQNQTQADRIKAELALMGFAVVVLPTSTAKGILYRVAVGPYNSSSIAMREQQRLQANNIKSILRKIQG